MSLRSSGSVVRGLGQSVERASEMDTWLSGWLASTSLALCTGLRISTSSDSRTSALSAATPPCRWRSCSRCRFRDSRCNSKLRFWRVHSRVTFFDLIKGERGSGALVHLPKLVGSWSSSVSSLSSGCRCHLDCRRRRRRLRRLRRRVSRSRSLRQLRPSLNIATMGHGFFHCFLLGGAASSDLSESRRAVIHAASWSIPPFKPSV